MVPNARRSSDSTITQRVKDVNIINRAGARESIVISRKICITTAIFPGCWVWSMPIEIKAGRSPGSAAALCGAVKKIVPKMIPTSATIPGNGRKQNLAQYLFFRQYLKK